MATLYTNKNGEKLYPVCKWEQNQHKLYNAHDRIMNAIYDAREEADFDELDRLEVALEELEEVMSIFEKHVYNGLVYASYKDGLRIKNYTWAYDARH